MKRHVEPTGTLNSHRRETQLILEVCRRLTNDKTMPGSEMRMDVRAVSILSFVPVLTALAAGVMLLRPRQSSDPLKLKADIIAAFGIDLSPGSPLSDLLDVIDATGLLQAT